MKEKTYSKAIMQVINEFLTSENRYYSFDEKKGFFKFSLSVDGKIQIINYIIEVNDTAYVVYAIAPIGVDAQNKEMMSEMAEFICRANFVLKNGDFEFDMDGGGIHFKCYVDCNGIIPTYEIIKNSIYCPAAIFGYYGDGIIGIIFEGMSGEEAIQYCINSYHKSIEKELRSLINELSDRESADELSSMLTQFMEILNTSDDETIAALDDQKHIPH